MVPKKRESLTNTLTLYYPEKRTQLHGNKRIFASFFRVLISKKLLHAFVKKNDKFVTSLAIN